MSEASNDHCWISLRHSKLDDAEHNLDSLLGQLYDDMDSKVQASHMIYLMSLDIDRLGAIASHKSAMGALTRVLREEGRKSFELRFNTISTFLMFSYFQNFHQLLVENQIGRATLSYVDLETARIHILPSNSAGTKAQSRSAQMAGDSNNAQEQRASTSCLIVNKPALHEQEKLLYMSICLLYHIAEDLQIEKKMRKFNLVVDCGFLHCFEDLLQKRKFEHLVWSILYNLSKDFDLRLKLSESKLISILVEPLLVEHEVSVPQELSALLINLTCIPKTAVLTLEVLEFEKFVTFVLRTNDMLLFKVVKNLSFLEGTGAQLIPFVPALVASLLQCEPCIQVEVMETLSNLTCIEKLSDSSVLDNGLLDYVAAHLHASNTEDDINLQIIMFIGGVCSHWSAPTISQAGLVETLGKFFADRCDDVDIVLQSLYAMIRFMLFDSTREAFLQQSFEKVVDCILRLSQDSEKAIVTMADLVIDAVCHFDEGKKDLIRRMRFDMFNSGWSEAF